MTELLAAGTIPASSDAFAMAGEGKIIADPLAKDEYVVLLEESPDGEYRAAVDRDGIGIQLNTQQPSQIFVGYGNYKVSKTATASAVGVGLES